jgi:hypothetical protein
MAAEKYDEKSEVPPSLHESIHEAGDLSHKDNASVDHNLEDLSGKDKELTSRLVR